jgi:mevalonate pyrophosphate decarboxylase
MSSIDAGMAAVVAAIRAALDRANPTVIISRRNRTIIFPLHQWN